MPQTRVNLHGASAPVAGTDGQSAPGLRLPIDASGLARFLASANEKLDDRRIALLWTAGFLVLGAALRLAWLVHDRFRIVNSEAFFLARAFVTKGELADAYSPIFNARTPA